MTIEEGILDIKVTVGPLCPVAPCNITETEKEAKYGAYSLIITNKLQKDISFQKTVTIANISQKMPVGDYEINISPITIFSGRGFPKEVKIEKDKTTNLTIDIDTGIR
ncbi:MAG: hypothetical protein R2822_05070 [Spirosomataceae bacterium]